MRYETIADEDGRVHLRQDKKTQDATGLHEREYVVGSARTMPAV